MFAAFVNTFRIPELRQRIIFTLIVLVFVRLGSAIPCPGINPAVLGEFFRNTIEQSSQGNVIGMINLFSGGALENCAIFSLTIMPYISASIIMQLAQGVIPALGRLAREEGGRQKINQFTRLGTLFLCIVQGYLLALSFENPERIPMLAGIGDVMQSMGPLVPEPGIMFRLITVVCLTGGTMLMMWMGEQITHRGIGNGVSLIIAVGILAQFPAALVQGWNAFIPPAGSERAALPPLVLVLLIAFFFIVIAATVMIIQAMRKIPVSYAKQIRGNRMFQGQTSYLPLKVNYAGVMPIIFASAILMFPATMITMLFRESELANKIGTMLSGGMLYYTLYGTMIFFFSYFWVAMVFNPTQIADDMKRNGGFVPGVRPGDPTARFLDFSMTRLTFAGAIFLVALSVMPMFVNGMMRVPMITASFFGGTSLLIIVGVMLDTMRQAETHLLQRHYDGFLKKGRIKGRSSIDRYQTSDTLPAERIGWLLFIVGVIIIGGIVAMFVNQ
ncbi:MAG: preprotein translocase subunit SecY [Verrucomicrobiota bacterium]